jgi:hypothetical protein
MQGDFDDTLNRFFEQALDSGAVKLPGLALDQTRAVMGDPGRRFTSSDLLELARGHDPRFSRRLVSAWPALGLLAPAAREGRGPRRGVGRTWPWEHVLVFIAVVAARARGSERRSDLANLPVFRWLLLGEEFVPLEQVHRALNTWATAARSLSQGRFRIDLYQHLLKHPEVRARLAAGEQERLDLQRSLREAPGASESAEVAALLAQQVSPLGTPPKTTDALVERYRRTRAAFDVGLSALPELSDEVLPLTRERYLENNIASKLNGDINMPDLIRHFGTESETACANAVTFIGVVLNEIEEAKLASYVDAGTRASLALTRFFATAAIAEREARDSVERVWRRRRAR